MELSTIAIPVTFVILSALLFWYLIGARGKWFVKFMLILIVPLFSLAIWTSLDSYLGWPTVAEPPEKFLVLWVGIKEPNIKTGDDGAIYILLRDMKMQKRENNFSAILKFNFDPSEPRIFKLPYSRGMHEEMERVMKMLKKGIPVIGEKDGLAESTLKTGDNPGDAGKDDKDGNPGVGKEQIFQFYELPPPKLPNKHQE